MNFISRSIALLFWATAVGLTGVMLYLYYSSWADPFFIALSLAIGVGAFGLVYARTNWRNSNPVSALIAVVLWVVAISALAATEYSFLTSRNLSKSAEAHSEQLTVKARDKVAEIATSDLDQYKGVRSSGEVSAELQTVLNKTVVKDASLEKVTKGCTSIQSWLSADCEHVGKLRIELAKAYKAERLNDVVWQVGTTAVQKQHTSASEMMTEAQVYIIMLLLTLCRDGILFIALAPKKKILGAPKSLEAAPFPIEAVALQADKVGQLEEIEEIQFPKKTELKVLEGGKQSNLFLKGKVVPADKKTAVFALAREAIKGGAGYHSADALHKMACAVATEWKWDHPGKFGRNSVGEAMQSMGYSPFKVRNVQTYDLGGSLKQAKAA